MIPIIQLSYSFIYIMRISSWNQPLFYFVNMLTFRLIILEFLLSIRDNQYFTRIKSLIILIIILQEKKLKLIKIYMYIYDVYHTFTKECLLSYLPNLPSYQTLNYHLDCMTEAGALGHWENHHRIHLSNFESTTND